MIAGDYEEEHRTMLEGGVWRDGERIFEGLSMNDVVVSRGATASMVELKIDIGDEFVANLRADGLIVASPTGSTAYALSAGGPILHPGIAGWVLVPIASHTLSNRPIVLPDAGEIRIEIVAGRDASANFDMQSLASLLHGDQVRVRRSRAPGALPAPARLELLRHAAAQAALVRGGGVTPPVAPSALPPKGASAPLADRRSRIRGGCLGVRAWRAAEMLRRLHLRDFVIVPALEVEFGAGFTVLTGETGAGKSILIDALQLALGSRGDVGVVREGAARAEIAAEFDAPASLGAWLDEAGFDDGDTLLLRRIDRQPGQEPGLDQRQPGHRRRSCARRPTTWSTSTASTPGRA